MSPVYVLAEVFVLHLTFVHLVELNFLEINVKHQFVMDFLQMTPQKCALDVVYA